MNFWAPGQKETWPSPPILQIMILELNPPRCVISKKSVQQKWIDEFWFRKQLSTCLFVMGPGAPPRLTPTPSQWAWETVLLQWYTRKYCTLSFHFLLVFVVSWYKWKTEILLKMTLNTITLSYVFLHHNFTYFSVIYVHYTYIRVKPYGYKSPWGSSPKIK